MAGKGQEEGIRAALYPTRAAQRVRGLGRAIRHDPQTPPDCPATCRILPLRGGKLDGDCLIGPMQEMLAEGVAGSDGCLCTWKFATPLPYVPRI
jgi:hypothetical protein